MPSILDRSSALASWTGAVGTTDRPGLRRSTLFLSPGLSYGLLKFPLEVMLSHLIRVNAFIPCPSLLIMRTDQLVPVPCPARIEQTSDFVPDRNTRILLPVGHGSYPPGISVNGLVQRFLAAKCDRYTYNEPIMLEHLPDTVARSWFFLRLSLTHLRESPTFRTVVVRSSTPTTFTGIGGNHLSVTDLASG
jgi:hypothetical protein